MLTRKEIRYKGDTISYLDNNIVSETTIFCLHGNSGSASTWQKQLNSRELSSYRLIAFDLPGHGSSVSLSTEQYNLFYFSQILSAAINQLANDKPYFLAGFSFGTNLVAELLQYDIKPKGMVLIGPCIIGSLYTLQMTGKEGADLTPLFIENAEEEMINRFSHAACHSRDAHDLKIISDAYKATHPIFRPAILQTAIDGKMSDEIGLLKEYNTPLLIITGQEDQLFNPHYLDNAELPLWNNKIYKIPNGGHFIHIDQPEEVNHLIGQYVKAMSIDSYSSVQSSAAL